MDSEDQREMARDSFQSISFGGTGRFRWKMRESPARLTGGTAGTWYRFRSRAERRGWFKEKKKVQPES